MPVASDFSISCRCVTRVDFFFAAVFAFGSVSGGAGEGAAVVWEGAGDGADVVCDGAGDGVVSGAVAAGAGAAGAGAASGVGEAAGAGVADGSFPLAGALWANAAAAGRLIAVANTIAITGKHFISNTPGHVPTRAG